MIADGETGWLFAPNDSDALAAKIRGIVENPAGWQRFPAAARARAKAMFAPEVIARQLQAIVGARLAATRQPAHEAAPVRLVQ